MFETIPVCHDAGLFSPDYATARGRFLAAVEQVEQDKQQHTFLHPLAGPAAEQLAMDTVWIGAEQASRVLVIGSACHGVEGFAGSAIQLMLLQQLVQSVLPDDTAVLLIHAINPWGFAWMRRTDEQGIDVNRNFVDFKKAPPLNRGYEQLAEAIVPHSLSASSLSRVQAQLDAYRLHHGQRELEEAISAGQYTHPHGLFYGGKAPGWSRVTLENLYQHYQLDRPSRVTVIDLHTGLGPYGYGEVISDHVPGSAAALLAKKIFGHSVTEPLAGTSSSVPKHGLMDYFWHRKLGKRGCFVTLEFGTFSLDSLWASLQADHWLYQYGNPSPDDSQYQQLKQQLLKHFNPPHEDWREMVLFRGAQVFKMAIRELANAEV